MRWIKPFWRHRIVKRFAFLPIEIRGEVRWLETVYVKQIYSKAYEEWQSLEFTTKEEYLKEKKMNEMS